MNNKGIEDLRVWQEARVLAREVYLLTQSFPVDERYNMTSQLRRAAVSVMSNIAEGQGRYFRKDFARFVLMARGSLSELHSLVILATDLEYLAKDKTDELLAQINKVGPMLNGLVSALQSSYEVKENVEVFPDSFYEEQGTRS